MPLRVLYHSLSELTPLPPLPSLSIPPSPSVVFLLCRRLSIPAEGSEVSAKLEFLNQQNLILSMENKTLKQRLESLA
ncbi:hypothetical protein Ahy_B02g059687 [Arachis hypogaea]|uniref:BZIP domain-containing protein n=1 Tax=Arachis hypogaea TaxID=3818 RepID=A0A445AGZ8_ARAHY|nr:hypothetical protein Ahy_B02g059687 [Arachis hypogaea]